MTLPQSIKGWTFVNTDGTIVTQTAVPFERIQAIESGGVKGLVSAFNRFVDRTISATQGSRSVPFGAGGVVVLGVVASYGTTKTISHRLGTSNLSAFWGATSLGGLPIAKVTFDVVNVTIVPGGDFTAPLFITVNA